MQIRYLKPVLECRLPRPGYSPRAIGLASLLIFLLGIFSAGAVAQTPDFRTALLVRPGQGSSGYPTEEWLRAIAIFNSDHALDEISQTSVPLTNERLVDGTVRGKVGCASGCAMVGDGSKGRRTRPAEVGRFRPLGNFGFGRKAFTRKPCGSTAVKTEMTVR